jgi:hypothetical protein
LKFIRRLALRQHGEGGDQSENIPYGALVALIGLVGGVVLCLSARWGDACSIGAIEAAA